MTEKGMQQTEFERMETQPVSADTRMIARNRKSTDVNWFHALSIVLIMFAVLGIYASQIGHTLYFTPKSYYYSYTVSTVDENGYFRSHNHVAKATPKSFDHMDTFKQRLIDGILIATFLSLILVCILRWLVTIIVCGFAALGIGCLIGIFISLRLQDNVLVEMCADGIALVIVCILLLWCRHKIRYGIEIVKEGCRAVTSSYTSIILLLVPHLLRTVIILAAAYIVVIATQAIEFPLSLLVIVLAVILGIWIISIIQITAQMILAHVYGHYYYLKDSPRNTVSTAVMDVLRYHVGTAIFGSFVNMTSCIPKVLLWRQSNNEKNCFGLIGSRIFAVLYGTKPGTLLDLVGFVNDRAFVITAMMGTDFWNSIKVLSTIMIKHTPLLVETKYAGGTILFFCKLIPVILSSILVFFSSPFDYYILHGFIFFIFAYELVSALFSPVDVAIDTLLISVLHEYKHTNTPKEYFLPGKLNQLLPERATQV